MPPAIRRSHLAITGFAALTLVSGAGVRAQMGVTPYKVNYNWDKLEGRKIGVASGIRLDPDGQHLWIVDRCGANGCAESTLDPTRSRQTEYGVRTPRGVVMARGTVFAVKIVSTPGGALNTSVATLSGNVIIDRGPGVPPITIPFGKAITGDARTSATVIGSR